MSTEAKTTTTESQHDAELPVMGSALGIVRALSDWSRKYPRGRIYSFHQAKMDDELIEIEEAAKRFIDGQEAEPHCP